MSTYTARQFAEAIGVSIKTLQRWDREGRLHPISRSPGNRRIYSQAQLDQIRNQGKQQTRIVLAYARVSRQAQKPDLENQKKALEQFCIARGIVVNEWVSEIGGGRNFKRQQFIRLVDRIVQGKRKRWVIGHQDRLARFGFDLIQHLCETNGCELLVRNTETLRPEREKVEDWMTIRHGFSARLYGLRNDRKAVEKARKDDQSACMPRTQDTPESHA